MNCLSENEVEIGLLKLVGDSKKKIDRMFALLHGYEKGLDSDDIRLLLHCVLHVETLSDYLCKGFMADTKENEHVIQYMFERLEEKNV